MWKPGQLVTIDGHVYRIRKTTQLFVCDECSHKRSILCMTCIIHTGFGCYPELLTPKTSNV